MIGKCVATAIVVLVAIGIGAFVYVQRLQQDLREGCTVALLEYKPPPRLIVISFDGFRGDYLCEQLTPNMFALARQEGVTGHMLPTFPTKTFPNHQSIATGLYQETHGIVHNVNHVFDPDLGEKFADTKEDGTFNHWWDNGLATPIYIANQLAEPSRRASCCAPWVGCHARYLGGEHRAHYHRRFNKTDQWREQFEWSLARMTNTSRPANLVMLYIPEPDMTGHVNGPYGEETLNKVRAVDQFVGYVRQRLFESELAASTNVIFLSDHGIAQISPSRVIVLESLLNSTWYDVFGCNPVLHLKPRPGYRTILAQAIKTVLQEHSHVRVLAKQDMPARFHYRNNRRIQDYVLVAEEGWSLHATQKQANQERHHRGQHGYDNEASSMRPLFLASGPAFKSGYKHPNRFVNVDLYPLMCLLLNIPANEHYHEGNLTSVAAMLR